MYALVEDNSPSAEGSVAVLSNLLVGLLGGTGSGLLDLLGDEVGALLDGIHCECGLGVCLKVVEVVCLNWY